MGTNIVVRVIAAHRPPDYPPISLKAGEAVTVGQRDAQWPAFVWCTCAAGEAWIPEAYLTRRGDAGFVQRDYSSREHAVQPGDEVTVLERCGGWALCRLDAERGWIPEECLQLDP